MADTNTSFIDLGLPPAIVTALSKGGIVEPTPIQRAAFPVIQGGANAYLQAETGTGKTLAYLLPLFCRIEPSDPNLQVIVLAPTHELAIQIQRQCTDLAQSSTLAIRTVLLVGGTPKDRQIEKLKKKPHIVVGSPGRILELIEAKKLKPHALKALVVDEVDRLLTNEHLNLLKGIFRATLKTRQAIFVSATEENETNDIISTLADNVVPVKTAKGEVNSNIEHLVVFCEERDKPELLRKLLHAMAPQRSLVFAHKNETAEIVAEKLAHHKIKVADIHGARDKLARKQAMDSFRSGSVTVLIASDLAARGLDIKGVSHVFNLDMPSDSNAYLHRVGRTGRAGEKGIAVSFLTSQQERLMRRIQTELGVTMTEVFVRGGEVFAAEN